MTTPADLDPVVLAIELDTAWEIAEGYRQEGERARRIQASYRQVHYLNQPKLDAFSHIASLVFDWEHSLKKRPAEHFLQLIQSRVKRANKLSRERAEKLK